MRRRDFLKKTAAAAGALCFGRSAALLARIAGQGEKTGSELKRIIPSSGEALPAVGLGTWQTFDAGRTASLRDPLKAVLSGFFELGGRLVDSSPMYGTSEEVTGDLAAELGLTDRLFFATKVWTKGREAGIAQMEESMRLFRREKIDLMQIHNLVDWKVHLETLRKWKEEGKIRYLGITHYTPSAFREMEGIMEEEELDFVQIPYSIVSREADKRLLPLAAEKKIAVIVNRPFEAGSLFAKVRGKDVPDFAREAGCETWARYFLKFILSHEAVTCVIPATAKASHLADNMASGAGRLPSAKERALMAQFLERL